MGNRKKAEALVFKLLDATDKSGKSTASLKELFANMSDKQMDDYVNKLRGGQEYIPIIVDNLNGIGVTVENNIEVAKKYFNHDFYQRFWYTDPITKETILTPEVYLVVHLPVRRQIQTLDNKISIPEDSKHIDEMTNQPTGISKGSSLSFPELLVTYSQGAENSIIEMIKFRGGDLVAMNAMEKMIHETGYASMATLETMNTEVKSTHTLGVLLKGMHLDNNFSGYYHGVQ